METDSLYFAPAEKGLEDCIRPEMKAGWGQLLSKECIKSMTADAVGNIFFQIGCDKHAKKPSFFKKEFSCSEIRWLCSKT